jgi:MFS family permease
MFTVPVRLFLVAVFIQGLGHSILMLMTNFYLESLQFDRSQIGLINGVSPLALVLSAWPIGRWSDRLGRRPSLILGSLIELGAALGFCMAGSFPLLLGLAAVMGIGAAMVSGNMAPFMTENTPEERRVTLFALQAAIMTVTGLFGNLVGGHLPEFYAGVISGESATLRATLLTGAGIYGLSLVPLVLIGVRTAAPETKTARILPPGDFGPLLFRLLFPHALIGLGAGLTMPFLNLYIKFKFHLEYDELSLLFGFSSVLTAAGMMVQPWLARKKGKVGAILITQAVSIPFLLILGFVPVFALVCVALLIRNMLMNMATPITSAFFMEKVPADRRATMAVMSMMTWSSGWAISTVISGWVQDQAGPDLGFKLLFGGMAICYVTSIVTFYGFWGRNR